MSGDHEGCELLASLPVSIPLCKRAKLTRRLRLPGKPLTEKNALSLLMEHGVMVGFGMPEKWMTRNLRFDLAWVNYTLFCSQSEELLAHAAGCNGA
jgi:hypothetical protein